MQSINDILSPDAVYHGIQGRSKKRVLEHMAQQITQQHSNMNANDLFSALIAREKLGSTGLGEGIAIPHCRLDSCLEPFGTLIQLSDTIDFDALDRQPVDILFILIVPAEATDEHLQLLAQLAEHFSQADVRDKIRRAHNRDELYQAMTYKIPAPQKAG